jgi:protein-tyrosine phosphatase
MDTAWSRRSLFPKAVREDGSSYRILFVCMGNICRSPTAEAVFNTLLQRRKLEHLFEVDSAGTHGYHVGEPPDPRTQRAAAARGYDLSQIRARKVAPQDIEYFDLILAMDKANIDNLRRLTVPELYPKIHLLMEFARHYDDEEVPDPYYGLGYGFDMVIDMVEDAAEGLLEKLLASEAVRQPAAARRGASGS